MYIYDNDDDEDEDEDDDDDDDDDDTARRVECPLLTRLISDQLAAVSSLF